MDHSSSNNILVNVSGTASIPEALGIVSEGENGETVAEVQHQPEQEEQMAATPEKEGNFFEKEGSFFLPETVLTVLVGLIDKFGLTKEQFLGIYEEYERIKFIKGEVKTPSIQQQLQVVQEAATLTPTNPAPSVPVESTNSTDIMDTGEQDLQGQFWLLPMLTLVTSPLLTSQNRGSQ